MLLHMQNDPPPPPHQKTREKSGQTHEDLGGWFPDKESAASYHADKNVAYHRDRLRAIMSLVNLLLESKNSAIEVVDFGIGDGQELSELGLPLSHIVGIDISPHMISLAQENLQGFDTQLLVGGVEALGSIDSVSTDLVVSTNVLGYLSQDDERKFFTETARILRPGGFVMMTLGNELFDLFALNSGTAAFFETYFEVPNPERLLTQGTSPRFGNARRHNPLALEGQLGEMGFVKVAYSFSQWHTKPPMLEQLEIGKTIDEARLSVRDHNFDANSLAVTEQWRALFQCSIFGALFQKN